MLLGVGQRPTTNAHRRYTRRPSHRELGLDAHVADASDQIVMDLLARLHGHVSSLAESQIVRQTFPSKGNDLTKNVWNLLGS